MSTLNPISYYGRTLSSPNLKMRARYSILSRSFVNIVNYTKAFDGWKSCLRHIEKCHDTFTFLVCSARYAQDIVPKLCSFEKTNVWKVYIYCEDGVFDMERLEFVGENQASSFKNPYLKHRKFGICF